EEEDAERADRGEARTEAKARERAHRDRRKAEPNEERRQHPLEVVRGRNRLPHAVLRAAAHNNERDIQRATPLLTRASVEESLEVAAFVPRAHFTTARMTSKVRRRSFPPLFSTKLWRGAPKIGSVNDEHGQAARYHGAG